MQPATASRRRACAGHAGQRTTPRAPRARPTRAPSSRHHPHPCRASPTDGEDAPNPGDAKVQDNLAAMLRLQIGAEEVKDLVAREEEKLIASAERIKAEAEAMAAEAAQAREAALDAALENINRLADEAEAELAARRAQIEADRADLAAWEADTAAARSAGLFFQGLHTGDGEGDDKAGKVKGKAGPGGGGGGGGGGGAAARMRAAMARLPGDVADAATALPPPPPSSSPAAPSAPPPDTAAAIVAAASTEVRSNLRYGVWLVLCIATGGVAVIDLFSADPALGADAAALGLAAWLGVSAAKEREALDAAAAAAAQRVAAARAAAEGRDGA